VRADNMLPKTPLPKIWNYHTTGKGEKQERGRRSLDRAFEKIETGTGNAAPRGGAAFRFSACRRAGRAGRRRRSVFCWADCTRTRVENWKF